MGPLSASLQGKGDASLDEWGEIERDTWPLWKILRGVYRLSGNYPADFHKIWARMDRN